MAKYEFPVVLQGDGASEAEAWEDACEAFSLDPGTPPEAVVQGEVSEPTLPAVRVVEFRLLVTVEDHGAFDEQYIRKAVSAGMETAVMEGACTSIDDETTEFRGWSISHVSTRGE